MITANNDSKKIWFKDWFSDEIYLKLYSKRNEVEAEESITAIQKFVPLFQHDKVLDLACGAGRHAICLAKRGIDVTAVDLSDTLLLTAKTDAILQNVDIKFIKADMREINFENEFKVVCQIFTSFGYFENNEDNKKVVEKVRKALKPSGYYVLDIMNKNFIEKNIVPETIRTVENYEVIERRSIENNYVVKKIFINSETETKEYEERVRLFSYTEIKDLLQDCSMTPIKFIGDYKGSEFDENESERMIVISSKK